MHRLLVSTDILKAEAPELPAAAAKHLKVLRPENGERVELFDGCGRSRLFAYDSSARRLAAAPDSSVEEAPRPAPLTLFACITKGSRWDWTIEKATELGVTRIVPVVSDRTIVRIAASEREAKRERWQRIAEDAARQSDSKWLPEILPAVTFRDALALVADTTCFVGALTDPPSPPLARALAPYLQPPTFNLQPVLSVFIGPEGDFTPEELAALLENATPTSFGSTILRAETAAIFAISVLKSFRD